LTGFRPFKPRYNGKVNDDVAGYFLAGPYMNYIAVTAENRGFQSLRGHLHEYEHFVTGNNLCTCRLWLDEAWLNFYARSRPRMTIQKFTLGPAFVQTRLYLKSHPLIPLKTLLAVDHKSPYLQRREQSRGVLCRVLGAVHYFNARQSRKRKGQLRRFIGLLNSDLPIEEMFRQAFQTELQTIEEELRSYIYKFAFPVLQGAFKQPRQFLKRKSKAFRSAKAEVHYYLGDSFLHLQRLDDAEARYKNRSVWMPGLRRARSRWESKDE